MLPRPRFRRVDLLLQPIKSSPPHTLWSTRKRVPLVWITAKASPDLGRASDGPVPFVFVLTDMGETIALPAQKIPIRPVQLGNSPTAGSPVSHAGTDEIRPRTAELARHADNADGLGYVFRLAATHAHAIREMQPVRFGSEIDRAEPFAIARPPPTPYPTGFETAFSMQPVHIDRAAGF